MDKKDRELIKFYLKKDEAVIKAFLSKVGKKGGSVKSERKAASSALNGKKGGRPPADKRDR